MNIIWTPYLRCATGTSNSTKTMKRIAIATVLLLLIGAGLYFANNIAAETAADELDAILAPKFEEMGAHYGGLEVNPAKGTITLSDITSEGGEIRASLVSVQSTFEDLLAAAQGTPDFLHGLTIHVEDFAAGEDDERFLLEVGDLHLDALIDVRALQEDPEAWALSILQQKDVRLEIGGSGWTVKSREAARDMGLTTSLMQFKDVALVVDKQGDTGEMSMSMDTPDFGAVQFSIKGNDQSLERLDLELNDFFLPIEDQMKLRLGHAELNMAGEFPIATLETQDWEDLILNGAAINWDVTVQDGVMEGRALREADLPNDRLAVSSLDHSLDYSGDRLVTSATFESNVSSGSMEVDWTIAALDPPDVNVETLEVMLRDVHPEIARALAASPLQPTGDNGYTFSYAGPLMGLIGAAL